MSDEVKKPSVPIVGAGLGGVLLGALLEKAYIPYTIFERSSSVKPLGKQNLLYYISLCAQVRDRRQRSPK